MSNTLIKVILVAGSILILISVAMLALGNPRFQSGVPVGSVVALLGSLLAFSAMVFSMYKQRTIKKANYEISKFLD